jgi:geranylgeranyl diphosphate synthase type II
MILADEGLHAAIEAGLRTHLPLSNFSGTDRLNQAIHYAIFPGGKRLRPVLTILSANLINGNQAGLIATASAVEFVHASSLIIDDLPSMDNARIRRSKAAVHLAHGEDIALLAAFALLNAAYGLFAKVPGLVEEAVECIGVTGMIGGQTIDLSCTKVPLHEFVLRNRKSSALMRLTMTAGALSCGASLREVLALARAGELIGEAYQAYDDYADANAQSHDMGKPPGQDRRHNRPSALTELGPEYVEHSANLLNQAQQSLEDQFGSIEPVSIIMNLVRDICARCGLR